jgi:peptidyl-tRNA hydrolase
MGMPHRKMLDQSAHIIETCERVIMRSDVMIRQLEISLQAALDKITEQAQRIKELEERK